ncbi:MAG TPA: bifunctional 4-hydroxy-2-oxoglutarate aldolase/2-dehydro-3-deoxy-phosphogluconate aldolase, partial [Terracidiphilus sp.]|nr:bifunctional 4-hydroxy-2-oxoglutarate aldolase/2-dehydro-3-deoxy-phosphogluconate aldolase [Terracidiphilus sp.]
EDGSIAMNVLRAIEQTRLIAILRGNLKDRACEVATALSESGVLVMEVTLNSPDALQAIRTIRRYAGLSVSLGAGTVLSPEEVKQAFDAGAEFIVSPNMSPAVIEETKRLGMASFPGCFTCTEILNGLACGADAIKLFPAIAFSPASLRAILASLGSIRLIPTGGITAENAADYLAAGAWAFGVGSEIVNLKSAGPLDTASLRERASAIVKAIREAPKENL